MFVTEPRTGGSVHQHAVESGPEPDDCDHVGDVFRLLHYSERQSYSRETQSEFSYFPKYFLLRYLWPCQKLIFGSTYGHLKYFALFSRVPCWICIWSRSLWAKQSLSSMFWTKVAPCYVMCPTLNSRSCCFQPCRRRCSAVQRTPCRVRKRLSEILTSLNLLCSRLNSFSSSSSRFLFALSCISWPKSVCLGYWKGSCR